MKSFTLIKYPELFQGENFLDSSCYFEGWYFKCSNGIFDIAFIPGISINKNKKQAFIQVITSHESYFIAYPISDFHFSHNPFTIQIRNNYFSLHQIKLDIHDSTYPLHLMGNLKLTSLKPIHTNLLFPNIMGPFSYIPSMECNHAILSMKHNVNGSFILNHQQISFHSGIGYIEKDWGTSFPKSYVWCQSNQFDDPTISFMFSLAHIPFYHFEFQGLICVLQIGQKEFKFTTYHGSKVIKKIITPHSIHIVLKKGVYTLEIKSSDYSGLSLSAPIKGNMEKEILESITSTVLLTFKKENQILFQGSSLHSGLEIVI